MVSARLGRARRRAARSALPAAVVSTLSLAMAHGTYVFDDTHLREERLTTLEVAPGGGEAASRAEGVTFGLSVGDGRASTVWIVTLVAVVLAAGVAVTIWVARRPPPESDGAASSDEP